MKVFKVNYRSHFHHLWLLLFLVIFVSTGLYVLMIFRYGAYEHEKLQIAGVIVFLLFFLPLILLHTNYYLYSNEVVFLHYKTQEVMIYKKGEECKSFGVKDVLEVVCYKSWLMAEERTPIFPWDIYNYASIKLKDGCVIKLQASLYISLIRVLSLQILKLKRHFIHGLVENYTFRI